MNQNIDWVNHTFEFAVVLIGILIAFQLNRCSDNRSKASLLKNHLDYIELECKENSTRLNDASSHVEEQLKTCDSLLAEIFATKDVNRIRNLSTRLLDMRNVDMVKDSYRVLVESGDIRYLKDYEKKRNIITLYDSFDKVEGINQSTQKLYDNHFYPYLKKHFDLVNWTYVQPKTKAAAEKYYAAEYANTISTYQYLLASKLKTYEKEEEMIQRYLAE